MFQQPVTPRVWRDEYKWAIKDNTHHTIILGNYAKEYFPTTVKLGIWQKMDSDGAKLVKSVLSGKYTIVGATWTDGNIDDTLEDIEELLKHDTEEEVNNIQKLGQLGQQETSENDKNTANPEYIDVDRQAQMKAHIKGILLLK